MWIALLGAASAQSDLSLTSVGVQTWTSSALYGTDADIALGERLRWTVAGDPSGIRATRLLADARFTLDPTGGDPAFEWASVRQLGAEWSAAGSSIRVGRNAVTSGGPRLYDGVEVLARPNDRWDVGGWAGLAPDVFTTKPALRPGLGPVVSYAASRFQASVVGDATMSLVPGSTGLDRVGVLTMIRATADRAAEVAGRLDVEIVGSGEGPRLVDGSLVGVLTPADFVRVDALYNAFSSYLYQETTTLDPDLQRFALRGQNVGLDAIGEDTRDPRLNHLVGGGVSFEERSKENAPRLRATVRNRFHPDPLLRYFRLNPQLGMVRIGGTFDLLFDGNYLVVPIDPLDALVEPEQGTQWDAGVMAAWFPADGSVGFDGSVRYVNAPDQLAGRGVYADLYVDVVSEDLGLLVTAGGSVVTEPDIGAPGQGPIQDSGLGAYLRVAKYIRRK